MPPLIDPRREAFAQAYVRCGNRAAAYREAGYTGGRGGASAMAAMELVAARIVELRGQRERAHRAGLEETIADLMAMADAASALKSAASLKEARIARLEANRLWEALERREEILSRPVERELTEAEWEAKYGHLARRC